MLENGLNGRLVVARTRTLTKKPTDGVETEMILTDTGHVVLTGVTKTCFVAIENFHGKNRKEEKKITATDDIF